MHFINRLKRYFLVSVLCMSTVFSMPVQARTKSSKSSAQKAAEQAAAAALQAEVDARYNKEIESNSWESWPAGPKVYAESAIVMEASTGTILYAILLHAPFQISLFHPVLKFIPTDPNSTAHFYYCELSLIRPLVDHASADLCQIWSFIKSKILYISIASSYSGLW